MSDPLSDFKFISADSHVNEPPALFAERMPEKLRDRVPHVDEVDGVPHLIVEGMRPRKMPKGRVELEGEALERAQAGRWHWRR